MIEPFERTPEFALIERMAEAIRAELGDDVEACPGRSSSQKAEPLNRVFRALARLILEPLAASQRDLPRQVSCILRRLVARRLEAGGLGSDQVQTLLDQEPGSPDDWLTFLLLVSWTEGLFWLTHEIATPG
jgi:hypothetical protein